MLELKEEAERLGTETNSATDDNRGLFPTTAAVQVGCRFLAGFRDFEWSICHSSLETKLGSPNRKHHYSWYTRGNCLRSLSHLIQIPRWMSGPFMTVVPH